VAVGKAAPGMHAGAEGVLGKLPSVMIVPEGTGAPKWAVQADHPVPTERNVRAARAVEAFVGDCAARGLPLLTLISGGTSALLASPCEGLSLEDLRVVTRELLASGATIDEMNAVRKHVERLKGGRLGAIAAPAPVLALIISDVNRDDPSVIGSGPFSPDPSTFADALGVVDKYGLGASLQTVRAHLERGVRGEVSETPKPGDAVLAGIETCVIAGNGTAVEGASDACAEMGYQVERETGLSGEAADIGRAVARRLEEMVPGTALVLGGETTVTLGERAGRGGRNQELALACAIELDVLGVHEAAVLSLATDGVDGPTAAAGGMVTGETAALARERAIDLGRCLREHDSYGALDALGGLIRIGPTGTNVADVVVGLRGLPGA